MLGEVPSIQEPDFVATVSHGSPAELRLSGIADGSATTSLIDLIGRLHDALVADGAREIVVEIRELELMSATAFNALVGWLTKVNELTADRRYQLRFRANPEIPWQQRSLQTLSCFATDLVVIESERGPA